MALVFRSLSYVASGLIRVLSAKGRLAACFLSVVPMAASFGLMACSTQAADFSLSSLDFPANGLKTKLATRDGRNEFGCNGFNVSPQLSWENSPAGTKGFAIVVHNPDLPEGSGDWWDWFVINLPASLKSLEAGRLSPAALAAASGRLQTRIDFAGGLRGDALVALAAAPGMGHVVTDFGRNTVVGPCPAVVDKHRYIFTIYALKQAPLAIPVGTSSAQVSSLANANSLAQASFTAIYTAAGWRRQ